MRWELYNKAVSDVAPSEFQDRLRQLSARVEQLSGEREHYRQLYLSLLERCNQLERGIIAERRAERHTPDDPQLSLQMLEMLLGDQPAAPQPDLPEEPHRVREHPRKPAGRRPLPEHLTRVEVEIRGRCL